MSAKHLVEFFYDIVSPWSYFGFEVISRYAQRYPSSIDLKLRPFFLGGVMKATGNSPPIKVEAKGKYMFSDLQESSAYFGVPITPPSFFPANTVVIQRLLLHLADQGQDIEGLTRAAWQAYWRDNRDISQPAQLLQLLQDNGRSAADAAALLKAVEDPAVKQRLVDNTSEAVARGAFGAPLFFVTPAGSSQTYMYFGSDRFHLLFPRLSLPWDGPFPAPSAKL